MHRLLLACLIAFLGFVLLCPSAAANGYGGAKQLILKAERQFRQGRDREALETLKEALRHQTTVGRGPRPYGYASYIFFRRARYYLRVGNRKRAGRELKRALKVKASRRFVDPAYMVTRFHPWIVKNFPRLAGLKGKRHPDHRIIPRAVYLHNGPRSHLYAVGFNTLFRLHRRTGKLTPLFEQPGSSLYRFDVHSDDNRMILAYERDRSFYLLTVKPRKVVRVRRRTGMHRIYFDKAARNLISYTRGGRYGLRVDQTALRRPFARTRLLQVQGRLVDSSGSHVVYVTWDQSGPYGRRFHPHYSPRYHQVYAYHFATRRRRLLFTFNPVGFRNRVYAFGSRTGRYTLVDISEYRRGRRTLQVHDWKTGTTWKKGVSLGLSHPFKGLRGAFSYKEDYLVFAETEGATRRAVYKTIRPRRRRRRRGPPRRVRRWKITGPNQLAVWRVDKARATPRLIGRVKISRDLRHRIYRVGVMKDNRTVWVHFGDWLILMNDQGRSRKTGLRRLSRKSRPEWAGPSYYVTDPEQFYLGIEKRGGRYFMKVDRKRIHTPRQEE